MTTKQQLPWIYALSLIFIAANLALISVDMFYGLMLPFVGIIVLLGLYRLDVVFMLIAFTTPLAIGTDALGIEAGIGVSIPSEPLM
ncbi:MAG: hypothetical protein HKN32_02120, partial [Flavobacteriales bacterium]|nr:hypothetical protein [Flavobacteriales bacterium]